MVPSIMQISFIKRRVHVLYITLAVISLLLAGVSYVRAEENAPVPVDSPAASQAKQKTGKGLSQEQQDRFINLVRNVFNRMDGAVNRLEDISKRLDARIAILNAQGINTDQATAPLQGAKDKLALARTKLAEAKTHAEDGIVSDTPRERFTVAREEFKTIRGLIRESFIQLREALAELKDAVMEYELNKRGASPAVSNGATATPASTTN